MNCVISYDVKIKELKIGRKSKKSEYLNLKLINLCDQLIVFTPFSKSILTVWVVPVEQLDLIQLK